jgi:hypothetical protein
LLKEDGLYLGVTGDVSIPVLRNRRSGEDGFLGPKLPSVCRERQDCVTTTPYAPRLVALHLPGDKGAHSVSNDAKSSIGSAIHGKRAAGMMTSVQVMSVQGKVRCGHDDAE